jgi:hypothetical protein
MRRRRWYSSMVTTCGWSGEKSREAEEWREREQGGGLVQRKREGRGSRPCVHFIGARGSGRRRAR